VSYRQGGARAVAHSTFGIYSGAAMAVQSHRWRHGHPMDHGVVYLRGDLQPRQ